MHHEGGRENTGHDVDRMCLLCTAHHPDRHRGVLRITGTHSAGFRFFMADGTEKTERAAPAVPASCEAREQVAEDPVKLAESGLRSLGCSAREAKQLVGRACESLIERG